MAKEWRPVRPAPHEVTITARYGTCDCGNEFAPGDELFKFPNADYWVCPDCYADEMREPR